jgi:hypothetical protein
MTDVSAALANKMNNFSPQTENAIEQMAKKQYKQAQNEGESDSPRQPKVPRSSTQRMPGLGNNNSGARSPLVNKSIEHIFGIKNLESDNVGQVVSNKYMQEASVLQQAKNAERANRLSLIPKGLKSK